MKHICEFCKKEFEGKKNRKFCGNVCAGKSKVHFIIERNKKRRKYPQVQGLSRQQVFWMYNPEARTKDLRRDTKKREDLVGFLGAKCVNCGYDKDVRALELDHKNNDGDKERKKYGNKTYRHYIKNPELARIFLQVLCANCNKIKAIEQMEHAKNSRNKFMSQVGAL